MVMIQVRLKAMRECTMKIKNAYTFPLLVLTLLVLVVQVSVPPESASVKACKRYASCLTMSSAGSNWLGFR
jgi:hypothetical protein